MYLHLHSHRAHTRCDQRTLASLVIQSWKVCLAQHNHKLEDSLLPLTLWTYAIPNVPNNAPSAARGELNRPKLPELR